MIGLKPMPQLSENQTARQCDKCGGTGFWCLYWDGERPVSNTGTKCFKCDGTGWIIKEKRTNARKPRRTHYCPVCQLKHAEPGIHYFTKPFPDGHWGPQPCEGMAE